MPFDRIYRGFTYTLCAIGLYWSVLALWSTPLQSDYRTFREHLKKHEQPSIERLLPLLLRYRHRFFPLECFGELNKYHAHLATLAATHASDAGQKRWAEKLLAESLHAKSKQLRCEPLNGKAWLDYALLHTKRSGFAAEALAAFKQSAYVTPREAWLSEYRVMLAMAHRDTLDREAKAHIYTDIQTLRDALARRAIRVMKRTRVETLDELERTFQ